IDPINISSAVTATAGRCAIQATVGPFYQFGEGMSAIDAVEQSQGREEAPDNALTSERGRRHVGVQILEVFPTHEPGGRVTPCAPSCDTARAARRGLTRPTTPPGSWPRFTSGFWRCSLSMNPVGRASSRALTSA